MVLRKCVGGRLFTSLIVAVGLLALGQTALAQTYVDESVCAGCHDEINQDFMQHGHPWIEVPTGGVGPTTGDPDPLKNNFGFASLIGEHGEAIGLPDPAGCYVALYLTDNADAGKQKWALVDANDAPFVGGDGKYITSVASLSTAQKAAAKKVGWTDVRAVFGNFKESAAGRLIMANGQYVSAGGIYQKNGTLYPEGGSISPYTKRCFHCHNPTGFANPPSPDDGSRTMYGIDKLNWMNALKSGSTILTTYPIGAPVAVGGNRLQGVRCQQCHGPLQPHGFSASPKRSVAAGGEMVVDKTTCVDCHSTTDPTDPVGDLAAAPNVWDGKQTFDANKRIGFAPTADGKTGVFLTRHGQGDEFRRSPHKNASKNGEKQACVLCHDPHKSVWHGQGGVKFADEHDEESLGMMCAACHQQTNPDYPNVAKVRLRTGMADVLVCTDCHMPFKSEGSSSAGVATSPTGMRLTHLFKINPTAMKASENVAVEPTTPFAAPTTGKYWKSTDLNGDSFLTLDMVCTVCHNNMSISQMAKSAATIHRKPGLIDLTINNDETLQLAQKTEKVAVDFSVVAGKKAGKAATIYVLRQGPTGWQSYNLATKKWAPGYRAATAAGYKLGDIPRTTIFNATLKPGFYTFFIWIDLKDGSKNVDTVPVWVGS